MSDEEGPLSIAVPSAMFFPDIGGAEVMLHNLATTLTERGHDVVVLPSFSHWLRLRRRGDVGHFPYDVHPLPPKQHDGIRSIPGYMAFQRPYFGYIQRRYDVDIWQAFGTFPAGAAAADFGDRNDVPVIVRTCGSDIQVDESLNYGIRRDPEMDRIVRRYTARCDTMIALTESVVDDCLDVGMAREDVSVIGCAVDQDRFDGITVDPDRKRREYGIPEDSFAFVTVGRNHPKKGFKNLVDALAILEEGGDVEDVHVVFVGRGMESVKEQARRADVRDRITFTGEVTPEREAGAYDLPPKGVIELYKALDCVVFPSLLETFGTVNIEAMAAGTPLISTDAPGCRDIVTHGENGLKATAGDPDDLAKQMQRLRDDASLREQLVAGGRRTVRESYTWNVVTDQYESLYRSLC